MKPVSFFFCFLLSQAWSANIATHDGDCFACVFAGYNYCTKDTECYDNRPNTCFTYTETPFDCSLTYCKDINIKSTDLFETRTEIYVVGSDTACIFQVQNSNSNSKQNGYFQIYYVDGTQANLVYFKSASYAPSTYDDIEEWYAGKRVTVYSGGVQYFMVQNSASTAAYFTLIYSGAVQTALGFGTLVLSLFVIN